jgi:hypothetical protein
MSYLPTAYSLQSLQERLIRQFVQAGRWCLASQSLPFWRRAVSQAANEVLAKDFNTRVRLKIRQEVNKYDQQLDKIMGRRQRDKDSRSRIIDEWPDSQLSYVANMGFKPANQNDILDAISFLVLGPHGIVDKFYLQITKVSTRTQTRSGESSACN